MSPDSSFPTRFSGHVYPQQIPAPDEIRPGHEAPWAHLDSSARSGLSLELVEERLRSRGRHFSSSSLPSEAVELRVLAKDLDHVLSRSSAVLVALYERDGETRVILTRRSAKLRNHSGEVSFPGGRSDQGEDPVATALREAFEEVGLSASDLTITGWLTPRVTPASEAAIWPVVATLAREPVLVANPDEVEHVFSVALAELAAEGNFLEERWRRSPPGPGADDEGFFPVRFFRVTSDLIWGATARILTELLCVALDVAWPDELLFDPGPPE